MSAVRTTYLPSSVRPDDVTILPYLTEHEMNGVLDALCDGRLVAVARDGEIVATAVLEQAERLCEYDDQDLGDYIIAELAEASRELESLREVVREVLAEGVPADFDYRIESAIDDVEKAILHATDHAEDL
jgi:hypothetical protein